MLLIYLLGVLVYLFVVCTCVCVSACPSGLVGPHINCVSVF